MIPEQLLREIDEREAEFSKSALVIFSPDKEQEGLVNLVCRTYLGSGAADKTRLANHLSNKEGLLNCLLGFAYNCAQMLKKTKNAEWLRLGLAAAHLAKMRMDYRDVLLAWAELYVVAEEAGITPDQAFQDICKIGDFGNYHRFVKDPSGGPKRRLDFWTLLQLPSVRLLLG